MKFLIDQDVYQVTIDKLIDWGHDVIRAADLGMQRASDEELLIKARELERIIVTRDKDFGTLTFLREELSAGIILLRVDPNTVEEIHKAINRLLIEHSEDELRKLFCVIEPHRYRIRRLD